MLHHCFVFALWSSQIVYVTSLFCICIVEFSDCLCKCYIVVLYLIWNSQIVHVNVTSLFCICNVKFSDCSCKCYIVVLYLHCGVLRLFMWMLHRCFVFAMWSSQIVYVNVTSLFCICIVKFSNGLCKCYIIVLDGHCEVLKLFM
jgi:hypothetical protein